MFHLRFPDMDRLKIIYIYDALCGWCYGFSPVVKAIFENYQKDFDFEVISGGMILGSRTGPIGTVAPFIGSTYKTIEETTGIHFGESFLRQVDRGEMILDSERPAIALSVFRSYQPENSIPFVHDLQLCIKHEGREPNEDEMYRYLAVNFGIDPDEFIHKMHEEEFKQLAYYDFALAKQLKVESYPSVFIQTADNHFYMIARGYANFETMELRIAGVLRDLESQREN